MSWRKTQRVDQSNCFWREIEFRKIPLKEASESHFTCNLIKIFNLEKTSWMKTLIAFCIERETAKIAACSRTRSHFGSGEKLSASRALRMPSTAEASTSCRNVHSQECTKFNERTTSNINRRLTRESPSVVIGYSWKEPERSQTPLVLVFKC